MTDPPFLRYDLEYLQPPEPDERGAEEREDDYWDEVDRAYDAMKDARLEGREHDYDYFDGVVDWPE